jgi:hypothetical protein
MENKELIFTVMVTFPDLLVREIESFNKSYGTDFKIIEFIDDEVPFCKIKVTKYTITNIFDLGYSLAVTQYSLGEKGGIDW